MSRENLIGDFGIMMDRFRELQKARMSNEETGGSDHITIEGLNDNNSIDLSISNEYYEKNYVAPAWASFIESIVKSATFSTNVTGTYKDDTLDASETLDSVNNMSLLFVSILLLFNSTLSINTSSISN